MNGLTFISTNPQVQKDTTELFEILHTIISSDCALWRELLASPPQETAKRLDLEARDNNGDTLLIAAASHRTDRAQAVRLLLDAGAQVDARSTNKGRETALLRACASNYTQAAEYLLDAGADPYALRATDGTSTLRQAAVWKHSGTLLDRLIAEGVEVNTAHPETFFTPLHQAVRSENPHNVQKLIAAGADVEAETFDDNKNALQGMVKYTASWPMAQTLLAAGASLHAHLEPGRTLSGPATEYRNLWEQKLASFRSGAYTPTTREDWNHLASVLPLEDFKNPPSVTARIQMLHEMRPDISLGGLREKALGLHQRMEGI